MAAPFSSANIGIELFEDDVFSTSGTTLFLSANFGIRLF